MPAQTSQLPPCSHQQAMLLHQMMPAIVLAWAAILGGGWLVWQLLRQNGRILLRLDELEKRLDQIEFGEGDEPRGLPRNHGSDLLVEHSVANEHPQAVASGEELRFTP